MNASTDSPHEDSDPYVARFRMNLAAARRRAKEIKAHRGARLAELIAAFGLDSTYVGRQIKANPSTVTRACHHHENDETLEWVFIRAGAFFGVDLSWFDGEQPLPTQMPDATPSVQVAGKARKLWKGKAVRHHLAASMGLKHGPFPLEPSDSGRAAL